MKEEIMDVVLRLEEEILDQLSEKENDGTVSLTYSAGSYYEAVSFCGIGIWNSLNDCRGSDEDGEYEPIGKYLRREINRITSLIGKIKM